MSSKRIGRRWATILALGMLASPAAGCNWRGVHNIPWRGVHNIPVVKVPPATPPPAAADLRERPAGSPQGRFIYDYDRD